VVNFLFIYMDVLGVKHLIYSIESRIKHKITFSLAGILFRDCYSKKWGDLMFLEEYCKRPEQRISDLERKSPICQACSGSMCQSL
jgi:hypothetical protein